MGLGQSPQVHGLRIICKLDQDSRAIVSIWNSPQRPMSCLWGWLRCAAFRHWAEVGGLPFTGA